MRKTFGIMTVLGLAGASIAAIAQSTMVDGQVKKVDEAAGKITIQHGALKKFDMEDGMTMVFRANDPGMLKQEGSTPRP